jgi:hypothetical protein
MKLVLTQPNPWPIHELETGPADPTMDPVVMFAPFVAAAPVDQLVDLVVGLDRPPFSTPEIVRQSASQSLLHWPVQVVESRIVAGREVLERRLTYIYFMLEWCTAVVFRASPDKFEPELERADALLASGRPDWRPGVVALSELLE